MCTDTFFLPPHDDDSHPISSLLNNSPPDAPFFLYEIPFHLSRNRVHYSTFNPRPTGMN